MKITQLTHRAVIRLSGADRISFLQGLISNDVQNCRETAAIYAALLTPQGKFLHDLFVIADGETLLMDCEAARVDDLLHRLQKHKLRAKAELVNCADDFSVWAAWGNGAATAKFLGGKIYADPRHTDLGLRIIAPKAQQPEGAASFAEYDRHRIRIGVADGSRDMELEKSTLLEGNFDKFNGISLTKGCYMGQELTARTHYRGLVKRRLRPVEFSTDAAALGAVIMAGDAEAGEVRSTCGNLGLALLRVDLTDDASLTCNGGSVKLLA